MRRGVALLITIGFIAVLIALVGYMFTISNRSFERVKVFESYNQNSIIFSDIKDIVDEYAKGLKDSDDLSFFLLGIPPFYDKKSGLSLYVAIETLNNKININSILIEDKTDEHIEKFISNIGETYNILDISFFKALILDTIDSDYTTREALSEIAQKNLRFSNSKIYSMSHFEQIVKYYVETTRDTNILKVPWQKLIFFGENTKQTLDCDRLDRELVSALGLDVETFDGCDSLDDRHDEEIIENFMLKPYSQDLSYMLKISIYYELEEREADITFDYDIKTGKIKNIELNALR